MIENTCDSTGSLVEIKIENFKQEIWRNIKPKFSYGLSFKIDRNTWTKIDDKIKYNFGYKLNEKLRLKRG